MKVLFCVGKSYFPIHQTMVSQLEAIGAEVNCLMFDQARSKQNIIEAIRDASVYITAVAPADREVIDAAPQLKYILKTGTGLDNVDIDYATKKGIYVSNAPGENATSVAELAIGLMVAISRKIPQLDKQTKEGHWLHSNGFECSGKTLGIIGFGSIGMKIARIAGAFDMKVIAYGVHKDYDAAARLGTSFVELDRLLAESDYIVVSTSLKKTNYHLVDARAIDKMKSSAFLINISRGALIDEPALFDALRLEKIGGAALDVFESEPPAELLPDLDNLITTPHIGGTTKESVNRVAQVTVENIRRFIHHEPLAYLANQKELHHIKQ
ncbi:phosphoglycerate dehydrogenase [Sporolactobacillus pectinivorans]|uniref:phosphoglycerate dehydrogenase n=1 Tax=Sporolactobacillus pectinivorans TaxID=1591408 RepID=UPI000C269B99|nr:phosphoglycerate dehydrogenase [Sporolactobacillus pectinivorans]